MHGQYWYILVFLPGLLQAQTLLNGFDLLDDFSEVIVAGENVVSAETPFSPQFSICMWVNPKRTIRPLIGFSLFELRATLMRRMPETPLSTNYPSMHVYVQGWGEKGFIDIQDQCKATIGKQSNKISIVLEN